MTDNLVCVCVYVSMATDEDIRVCTGLCGSQREPQVLFLGAFHVVLAWGLVWFSWRELLVSVVVLR